MKPELKTKWIENLRSGEIKQTTNFLERADNSQCCLGVLCNIMELPKKICDGNDVYDFNMWHNWEESILDKEFLNEIGLSIENSRTLMRKNDNGETFYQIADWIEEHV